MRAAVLGLVFGAALAASSPALACLGEPPPPPWSKLYSADGPPMIIGRVVDVSVAREVRQNKYFDITDATATIERLHAVQGETRASYTIVAAHKVERRTNSDYLWCGDFMRLRPGEIVLGFERRDGTLLIVPTDKVEPAELKRLIESYQ